jgi:hypothetical protein
MSPFKDITGDVPLHLRTKLTTLAKGIWSQLGGKTVIHLDHWWNTVKISYIPPSSPSVDPSPDCLLMNLVEGESDFPSMSARYTINFMPRRIKVKDEGRYEPIPAQFMSTVDEMWAWAKAIPEREAQSKRAYQLEAERARQRQREADQKRKQEEDDAAEAYEERNSTSSSSKGKRKHSLGTCLECGTKVSISFFFVRCSHYTKLTRL